MTHDSNNLDTSIEYRVTGPAVYCGGKCPKNGAVRGKVVKLTNGLIDYQGDVRTVGHGYITASSLTPVTGSDDIRIPRADLPEVVEVGKTGVMVDGRYCGPTQDPQARRKMALENLAIAEYLERRESEAVAAEERRNTRRDELAGEYFVGIRYASLNHEAQRAIRRIIELEDAAK